MQVNFSLMVMIGYFCAMCLHQDLKNHQRNPQKREKYIQNTPISAKFQINMLNKFKKTHTHTLSNQPP